MSTLAVLAFYVGGVATGAAGMVWLVWYVNSNVGRRF
jgi:hypothetical protein